jgi:hypothetical protein
MTRTEVLRRCVVALALSVGATAMAVAGGSAAEPTPASPLPASPAPSVEPSPPPSTGSSQPAADTPPPSPEDEEAPPIEPGEALIYLEKEIDSGAATDIVGGWSFGIEVSGGTASASTVVTTDDLDPVSFTVSIPGTVATVWITEVPQPGTVLLDAQCVDHETQESIASADSPTMQIDVEPGHTYTCLFRNRPTDLASTQIEIQAWIQESHDPDAPAVRAGAGWSYGIDVTGGTPSDDVVTTGSDGRARFEVSVGPTNARVRITERSVDVSDIVSSNCWDALGEDDIPGGFDVDGASISFTAGPAGGYICQFFNLGEVAGPLPTPPATDAGADTGGSRPSAWWFAPAALMGLGAWFARRRIASGDRRR